MPMFLKECGEKYDWTFYLLFDLCFPIFSISDKSILMTISSDALSISINLRIYGLYSYTGVNSC